MPPIVHIVLLILLVYLLGLCCQAALLCQPLACFFKGFSLNKKHFLGFPGGAVVENLPANAGDTDSSPGLGRSHMPQSD